MERESTQRRFLYFDFYYALVDPCLPHFISLSRGAYVVLSIKNADKTQRVFPTDSALLIYF